MHKDFRVVGRYTSSKSTLEESMPAAVHLFPGLHHIQVDSTKPEALSEVGMVYYLKQKTDQLTFSQGVQ